jgi:hypothetical protein
MLRHGHLKQNRLSTFPQPVLLEAGCAHGPGELWPISMSDGQISVMATINGNGWLLDLRLSSLRFIRSDVCLELGQRCPHRLALH